MRRLDNAGWSGFWIGFACCVLLSFCSDTPAQGIDFTTPPAADWPILKKVYHYGDITPCTAALGITTIACAFADFDTGTCHIYLPAAPVLRKIVLHEEAHCDGYDHDGETSLHDRWEKHKKELLNLKPQETNLK
jgi:hypothetical protein